MSMHGHFQERDHRRIGFLKSPAGLAMVGFMAIGAFLLFTEHRPHVLIALVWASALACPLMHLFHGHRGHAHRGEDDDARRGGGNM
jgi:Protein of unknown function (DUF2933)